MAAKTGKAARRSPAMQQFFRAKEEYPDAILFFRMGDFYEMFYEDAVLASQLLDLTLTSRGTDESGVAIPMAGVPHHAASGYLARLVEQGQRVAVCEQMEDPSKVKGVVPRAVVRVVTPGLVLEPDALDARSDHYLVGIAGEEGGYGLAVFELSTAEARACKLPGAVDLLAELTRLDPREALVAPELAELRATLAPVLPRTSFRSFERAHVEAARGDERLAELLAGAEGEGDFAPAELDAVAAVLGYAQASQPGAQLDVQRIAPYDPGRRLLLDDAAVRNLELVSTLAGDRKGSLLDLIDMTRTAMGARMLKRRVLSPLCDLISIRRRHDQVEALRDDAALRDALREVLTRIPDIERLATRAALGVATPRDLSAIGRGLGAAAELATLLGEAASHTTDDAVERMRPTDVCDAVARRISDTLAEEAPQSATQAGIFRSGFDPRIDELRELSQSSKDVILRLEQQEREQTGINNLKIRYTRVFGYYIEISKTRAQHAPDRYRRKQTVANAERFTTEELDQLQAKILNADERLRALELELFEGLRAEIGREAPRLRRLARELADIDVHACFAEVAHRYDYARPLIDDSPLLSLEQARHPIVERTAPAGSFVPNDVTLEAHGARLMVITGPNMAGKSTAMRQVALAVILAQAGGFVPCARAHIGLCDRIYTRVGASDNVAQGESTFMVEMRETAAILKGATARSLVILDEIGRGTSTYDGLAIAWAVAEHLHDVVRCRTMFATHYHELCELARTRGGVVNFNVAARESGDRVVFLRTLVPGGANRSYGVAVAKLAGVPELVLARARAMLDELESGSALPSGAPASMRGRDTGGSAQLDMFPGPAHETVSEVESTLRAMDVDRLTPVEALVALARLRDLARKREP